MSTFKIVDREMTSEELARMNTGFDENSHEHDVAIQTSERYGFVALSGDTFIGCVSGLATKNGDESSGWFYLTDLFIEKEYRLQGLGADLLAALQKKIVSIGVVNIWTWTAGYEALVFYRKQGYEIFAEMENWYSDGSSRFGLKKKLR